MTPTNPRVLHARPVNDHPKLCLLVMRVDDGAPIVSFFTRLHGLHVSGAIAAGEHVDTALLVLHDLDVAELVPDVVLAADAPQVAGVDVPELIYV